MSDEFNNNEDSELNNSEHNMDNMENRSPEGEQESERVYRVNEEYVSGQSDSQYRYKFERGTGDESPRSSESSYDRNVTPGNEGKKSSGVGKKIVGVAAAVGVFAAVSGGLILASHYLTNGDSENGSGTSVAGLTHDKSDETVSNTDSSAAETEAGKTTTLTTQESEIAATGSVSASLLDVSDVVEEVMPTVVSVTNTTIYSANNSYWSWFGSSMGNSDKTASGAGSGVIIADNGEELLIVTNAHVVNPTDYSDYGYTVDTSEISISFCNDVTVDAVVKGTDDDADLAVIAVDLDDIDDDTKAAIKIATVGNSDDLKVGNGVIAIGNALGFGQSVTVGYVSAVNREVTIDNVTRTLLQTDAAINPGNSGGGLFNTNGMLVAINSAKYASEEVEGIGYAIPISSVEGIITDLMNKETVVREKVTDEDKMAWLGISADNQYSNFYDGQGAFISSVTEDGPADNAGLMAYDIITAINDVEISSWNDLLKEMAYHEGGETVTVTYYTLQEKGGRREYVERETEVTLGFKKDMPETDSTEEK